MNRIRRCGRIDHCSHSSWSVASPTIAHFALPLGSDDQSGSRSRGGWRPDSYRPPVYYTRLVWTWLLIGWGTLGSLTLEWTSVLMFILGALTILLVAAAARTAFNDRAALLAALVYAAHPLAITFDTAALPDGLAVCLLAATIAAFIHYLKERRARTLLICGLIIGLQFGVKNYFMLVSLPCALTIVALHIPWRQRCAQIGLLAGSAIAGLAVALLIGAVSGVGVGPHIEGAGHYVDYISQGGSESAQMCDLALRRPRGGAPAFFGFCGDCLTLFGLIATAVGARRNPVSCSSRQPSCCSCLMLMPVRLSPLTFTNSTNVHGCAVDRNRCARARQLTAGLFSRRGRCSPWWLTAAGCQRDAAAMASGAGPRAGADGSRHAHASASLPIHFRPRPDAFTSRRDASLIDFASTASLYSARCDCRPDLATVFASRFGPHEKLRTGDYSGTGRARGRAGTPHAHGYSTRPCALRQSRGSPADTRGQLVAWLIRKPVT